MQMPPDKPGAEGAIFLTRSEIARRLDMETCIRVMHDLYAGLGDAPTDAGAHRVTCPVRNVFALPSPGPRPKFFGSMPAHARFASGRELFGAKCLSVFPGNPRTNGRESHQGIYLLFDEEDGRLPAMFDAAEITAQRTAATSAMAARVLLPTGCSISEGSDAPMMGIAVAIVGTGVQARRHALAFATAMHRTQRPVRSIRICAREPGSAAALACQQDIVRALNQAALAARAGAADPRNGDEISVEVQPLALAAQDCDIICTVTSSKQPVLTMREHLAKRPADRPVLTIAVGACTPDARELGGDIVKAAGANIWVDNREAAAREAGDLLLAAGEECLAKAPAELQDLGEVVARPPLHNANAQGPVLIFKSLGNGAQDLAVARHLYDEAQAQGVGVLRIEFEA